MTYTASIFASTLMRFSVSADEKHPMGMVFPEAWAVLVLHSTYRFFRGRSKRKLLKLWTHEPSVQFWPKSTALLRVTVGGVVSSLTS